MKTPRQKLNVVQSTLWRNYSSSPQVTPRSEGCQARRPMRVAFIGGLVALILVPTIPVPEAKAAGWVMFGLRGGAARGMAVRAAPRARNHYQLGPNTFSFAPQFGGEFDGGADGYAAAPDYGGGYDTGPDHFAEVPPNCECIDGELYCY